MRDLVERGHIFIAQPPLYKIRKGKQEQYLKDDLALANYQVQIALEGSSIFVNSEAPGLAGDALETLVKQFNNAYAIISRLARLYPTEILDAMIFAPPLPEEHLKTKSNVEALDSATSRDVRHTLS